MSVKAGLRPVHPGEVLRDELEELEMSANALAKALDVPTNRISEILRGRRGVTADTALRLNLQSIYELRLAEIAFENTIKENVMSKKQNRSVYPHQDGTWATKQNDRRRVPSLYDENVRTKTDP